MTLDYSLHTILTNTLRHFAQVQTKILKKTAAVLAIMHKRRLYVGLNRCFYSAIASSFTFALTFLRRA